MLTTTLNLSGSGTFLARELRTVCPPVHYAPLDHRRWQTTVTRWWSGILPALYSVFKVHQCLVTALALVRHRRFWNALAMSNCCGMCAVLCRLIASARCQRRCALAVRVSGFNWASVVVKVHAGRQCAVRLLCGGAVQRSRCGYVLCGGLLCYAHDTAFRNGLQVLLEHNILCFSAENSAF